MIAFVDGASPFAAALIVMIPFAFTSVISMHTAYFLAVVVGLVELFFLGMFLGAISRERLWLSGLRLVVAGVIALGDQPAARRGRRMTARGPAGETADHPLLAGLNPEQRKAVMHVDGPLLILAGAGSGKTRVLTHRVAWLIQVRHVRPDEVVAITFTNKAAGEMKERIEDLVGPVARTMWISTFHSMCARLLRREAQRMGYKSSVHHPRRGRPPAAHQALHGGAQRRPQALPAGVDQPPDQRRQEPAAGPRPVPRAGRALRADRRRRLRAATRSATPR